MIVFDLFQHHVESYSINSIQDFQKQITYYKLTSQSFFEKMTNVFE